MKAILPVAGYGTRLYPLTLNKAKALLEVKGKPMLEHVLGRLIEMGVKEALVVSNEKFANDFGVWAKSFPQKNKIKVKVVNDRTSTNETRLGQIGDIDLALKEHNIDDDIIIIAGDNIFNFSLKRAMDKFRETNEIVNVLYDLKSTELAREFGVVETNEDMTVKGFEEKPNSPKTTFISTGIYVLPKKAIEWMRTYLREGNSPDKMGEFLEWAVKRGHPIHAIVHAERWFDIGNKEALDEARENYGV